MSNRRKNIEYTHGGNLEAARDSYGRKRFIDLSVNINPWGPPLSLWVHLITNLRRVREYPEPYSESSRQLLANFFKLSGANFLLGNGAAELIGILPQALPVNRAIILEPTFTEYRRAFEAVGKPVCQISLTNNFEIPLDQVASELKQGDLLFICQPNNPTGKLFKYETILKLLELAKAKQSWLVIDESFLWFCSEIRERSLSVLVNDNPTLVIINSLTKIGALPGLRLGFAIGAPDTTKMIGKVLNQWNLNGLAQQMIASILKQNFLQKTLRRLDDEKKWLQEKLAKFEAISIVPGNANFYLIKLNSHLTGSNLVFQLANLRILVRDCSNFEGLTDNFIRIAVGRRRQNRCFIKTLEKVINHAKQR